MFENLLFVMSLSGTVICVLYMVLYPLASRYFSLEWRYCVLKTAIVFFLVPFSECKFLILKILFNFFPNFEEALYPIPRAVDNEYMIIAGTDQIWLSLKTRITFLIMFVAVAVACFNIRKEIANYRRMTKLYMGNLEKQAGEKQQKLFSKIKKELNLKKDIRFFCCDHCKTPMSGGILSPAVIFPIWDENQIDADLYEYMVKHELVHIKHHDLLIKFMGILVMSVHWFNPFSYFLHYELSSISEMYCDSIVMHQKTYEEICKYAELIIDLASDDSHDKLLRKNRLFAGAANSKNKIVYKRRILEMKKVKKHKTALSMITMAFLCMTGGITAFAYNPPNKVSNNNGIYFEDEDFNVGKIDTLETEKISYDSYFVDNEGNIFVIDNNNVKPKAPCIHEFVDGNYRKHDLLSDGGCVTTYYEAKQCRICGYIKISSEIINTVTYKVCPH